MINRRINFFYVQLFSLFFSVFIISQVFIFPEALRISVEDNAPDTLPVHEVNQDLSKAFGAADYLDALHAKKAPVTLVQTIARGVAKFGGAAIANHLPFVGGELISDFAGYQVGKYIENALENMSKPGRANFLANLQKYEPESYASLQKFIDTNNAGNPHIPRLPEGTPTVPVQAPIPMGGANSQLQKIDASGKLVYPTQEAPQLIPAKRGLPAQDPKTGKMKRVYTSQ